MSPSTRSVAALLLPLLGMLLVAVPVGALSSAAAEEKAPADATATGQHSPRTPIHHVVLMLQQGHTFDSYFGTRPQVDGIPGSVCLPRSKGGPCVAPYAIHGSPHVALLDTARAQRFAVDSGQMDRFVRAQEVHGRDARVAMGHYGQRSLPVLDQLADRGAVFDHWFSGVPGGPVANDLFAVAGTAPRRAEAVPARGWHGIPMIFDRLLAAGVPWRVYVEGYRPGMTVGQVTSEQLGTGQLARAPLLATPRFHDGVVAQHVSPLHRYYVDLAKGALPAVSFVVTTEHTERPPRDPAVDQGVVRGVVNALIASTAWAHSAFLLSYDSAGGWYDHVRPPVVDGRRVGLRVPTVLLSPYVLPGRVIHRQYDAAAPLKLIEQNWGLDPLTRRDRHARSLLPAFYFTGTPGRAALLDVKASRPPVVQPDTRILYTGYLFALVAALACVAVVALRDEQPENELPGAEQA